MYIESCKTNELNCDKEIVEAKIGGVNYTYCCQKGMNKTLEQFLESFKTTELFGEDDLI